MMPMIIESIQCDECGEKILEPEKEELQVEKGDVVEAEMFKKTEHLHEYSQVKNGQVMKCECGNKRFYSALTQEGEKIQIT